MAEATYSEIQTDLTSVTVTETETEIESAQQQMVERQSLLSSHQPSDPSSSNYLPQQQIVEDDVTINIRKMIQDCEESLLLHKDRFIYRVPSTLRHLNEEAYIPIVVSVGPFHYGNKRLQDMERDKKILFKRFIQRARLSLDDLVDLIKRLEPDVRASYSKAIELTKQELVELILMDAGFIIELFIMKYKWNNDGKEDDSWKDENLKDDDIDAILSQPWLGGSIRKDLLLLENQLPFFVIADLFNEAFPRSCLSFLKLTYEYFDYYNHQKLVSNLDDVKIKHFTDLLRLFYLEKKLPQRNEYSTGEACHILSYNANALQEAGIKLMKARGSECLLDLNLLGHNTLKIPKILVDDGTERLFRNMIALEQCHYPGDAYITDYLIVLDCLIDTHKDVDLLVDKDIVSNDLGDSNNVASLFNGLLKNVPSTFNSKYLDICTKLNVYCQTPRHKMKATLRRDYCRTPWQIVASIAAAVLLFLTVVQTIFSILQVVEK